MPYTISSPPFSFVRFTDAHLTTADWSVNQIPGTELGFFLPVNRRSDVSFQVLITASDKNAADALCNANFANGGLILSKGANLTSPLTFAQVQTLLGTPGTIYGNNVALSAQRLRISDTEILLYFPQLPDLSSLACEQCFQLIFVLSSVTDQGLSPVSNGFVYRCDDTDFTSVLNYYSNYDEAGFLYCNSSVKNRVRLPLYLTRPTYPDEEETLRESTNSVRIRKSTVRKLYEVVTDLVPDWIMEGIRAIFIHDEVVIGDAPELPQTMPYKGEIVKEGAFEPRYVDYKNFPLATLSLRVNAVDYHLQKNNCGVCPAPIAVINVTNHSVGNLTASTPYIVDLLPLASANCFTPLYYVVERYQLNYIESISITQGSGAATLTFRTRPILTPDGAWPPPLITIRVSAGGATKTFNITSTAQ